MSPLNFFHHNFASKVAKSLGLELPIEDTMKLSMPCPTVEKRNPDGSLKKASAVQSLRMGAKDVFFLCTEDRAVMISPFHVPSSKGLEVRGTESVGAKKQVAQLLLEMPESPFMVGTISKANAEKALRISPHTRLGYFCEMGAGFSFDIGKVKQTLDDLGDLDWKQASTCLYRWEDARFESARTESAIKDLEKAYAANPDMERFVEGCVIVPNSGEFELLKWLNFPDRG